MDGDVWFLLCHAWMTIMMVYEHDYFILYLNRIMLVKFNSINDLFDVYKLDFRERLR